MKPGPQVVELAKPFPSDYVHTNPSGGGSYVKHHVVNQRAIQIFGRPPSFERVEVVFGDVAAIPPNPNGKSQRAKEGRDALKNVIVGVIARMTVVVDGEKVVVEEAGDCEEPHNWSSDGQRLKDAMSDAYKRCAMRLGLGLHLWSQDEYFLYKALVRDSAGSTAPTSGTTSATPVAPQPEMSAAPSAEEGTEGSPASEASGPSYSSWDELKAMFGSEIVWQTAKQVAKDLKDGLVPIKPEMLDKCSPRVYAATAEVLAQKAERQPQSLPAEAS